jgi:putative copper export protein
MTTSHSTPVAHQSPRPAAFRPRLTKRAGLALLDAALVLQVAAWITAVLTTSSPASAFTQPHPGFRGALIVGGAIWLVQFAAAVLLAHKRARSHH